MKANHFLLLTKILSIILILLTMLSSCVPPNDENSRTLPDTAPAMSETIVQDYAQQESIPVSVSVEKDYILNTNTRKFHYPSCPSVEQMNESNKKPYTGTRNEIIAMGYDSCGRCFP